MTSTETLKAYVRNISANTTAETISAETRGKLAAYKTQLLHRGYITTRGARSGVSFASIASIPDDAPAWSRVKEYEGRRQWRNALGWVAARSE